MPSVLLFTLCKSQFRISDASYFFIGMEQKPTYRRYSEETSERGSPPRRDRNKRWSDLHLTDMVFTNEGVEHRKGGRRDRESWKRWSDLQLRQDAIVTKIGELDEKRNPKLLTQVKVK